MTITLTLRAMTPDAVPDDAPASRLLAAFQQRAAYAIAQRDDLGAGVGGHALTALALGVAVARRIDAQRLVLIDRALQAGAGLQAVADALGVDVEDVRASYSTALDERVLDGRLTPAEAQLLGTLVDDGEPR